MTLNLAYSHVFFEDGSIDRTTEFPVGDIRFLGDREAGVDLFAVSLNIKFGAPVKAMKYKVFLRGSLLTERARTSALVRSCAHFG
jgi:hypothetical protein